MIDIAMNKLSKSYFSGEVFSEASLEVKKGERIALLGDNGTGKTTLFKILMGEENYQAGDVFIRSGLKLGLLRQQPETFEQMNVVEVLKNAFIDLEKCHQEMIAIQNSLSKPELISDTKATADLLQKLGKLQEQYEIQGGYEIEERLSKICIGLNIDETLQKRAYDVLSGGEKTRIILAKLLLESPDVLLLDEPTNHLDLETTEWLEQYLNAYSGSVIIISHDRYFLDRVINKIYELKSGKTHIYYGNYSDYLKEREVRYELELKKYEGNQRKVKQLEEAAHRMRQWAKQADNPKMFKKAKAMEKRIEKMDKIDRPIKDKSQFNIQFDVESEAGKIMLEVVNHPIVIDDLLLIKSGEVRLYNGMKMALIGPNGCGKSTLIRNIMDHASPELKTLRLNPRAKIGYLKQDIEFQIEKGTILEVFKHYHPESDGAIRNELAKFQFYSEDVFKQVATISGGERVRLMLAILMKQDINFLILDEPTNHIDIKTREVLEIALSTFEGTVLFISHDRYFINCLAQEVLAVENKELVSYSGNYEAYREKQKEPVEMISKKKKMKKVIKKESILSEATKANPYKLKHLETQINEIEDQMSQLKIKIENHSTDYHVVESTLDEMHKMEELHEKCLLEYIEMTENS